MSSGNALGPWVVALVVGGAVTLAVLDTGESATERASADQALAWVGEVPILPVEVENSLSDSQPTDAQRQEILERLIREELWLQHALSDGVLQSHRGLREAVTRHMLDVVLATAAKPDVRELEQLYQQEYPPSTDGKPRPSFERARKRLMEKLRLEAEERALESYLAWLRSNNNVEVVADEAAVRRILDRFRNEPEEAPFSLWKFDWEFDWDGTCCRGLEVGS